MVDLTKHSQQTADSFTRIEELLKQDMNDDAIIMNIRTRFGRSITSIKKDIEFIRKWHDKNG